MTSTVLIAEDDPVQQRMLDTFLKRKMNLSAVCVENGQAALNTVKNTPSIRVVFLDLNMPVMDGMKTLERIKDEYPDLPVIMLTGSQNPQDAVNALQKGACDFINKPFDPARLTATVKNALALSDLSNEIMSLKRDTAKKEGFSNIIGHSGGLSAHVQIGRRAAQTDIPVLITGETGTGKEVFARAIHAESDRAGKPFIAVNCGALPGQLIESILFGHEKGAFTGATEKTRGKFREAEGGTILLDEVGELPLDAQVKLLRVLQEREIEPVGSSKAVPVNVRIISATNRNLVEDIKTHRFREDLYYRLNVLEINLPPLHKRAGDIPFFLRHFVEKIQGENRSLRIVKMSQDIDTFLMNRRWPGNVRELENAIYRAMVLNETYILNTNDFRKVLPDAQISIGVRRLGVPVHTYSIYDENGALKPMHMIERDMITLALHETQHNVTKAAEILGMAKSTLYRKIQHD